MRIKIVGKGYAPHKYEIYIDGVKRDDVTEIEINMAVAKINTAKISFHVDDIEIIGDFKNGDEDNGQL
jgi:hypothetical protein